MLWANYNAFFSFTNFSIQTEINNNIKNCY